MLVAPLLTAPAVAIAAMTWARHELIQLRPEATAIHPPTISMAITHPEIGDPFALWMLVVAACQAFAAYRVTNAIRYTTFSLVAPSRRPLLAALLSTTVAAQIVAIAGVVTLSQYTGSVSTDLHALGSYMMFFGNGISITLCGVIFSLDMRARAKPEHSATDIPAPYLPRTHTRLATLIAAISLFFGVQYFGYELLLPLNPYLYRLTFAMTEYVLLLLSLLYLAGFLVSMYRYEYRLLSVHAVAADGMEAAQET